MVLILKDGTVINILSISAHTSISLYVRNEIELGLIVSSLTDENLSHFVIENDGKVCGVYENYILEYVKYKRIRNNRILAVTIKLQQKK